jgi:DNA polymerase III subunit gamma/tau
VASQSLYRKYRPEHFGELVGQDHVTVALRNAVREGRTGHAYLFSGPRGTGKTTTARILARALNCLDLGADGEPCGKCENCQSFASGSFFDLVELDAASNRGIDSMRSLIQSVHLGLGATSRRKVYVLDEVHMLTTEASNVLLKTLEEPPEYVTFVLATTDPQKVLPTISSRTQHFEFNLLSYEELIGHLADILAREGVEADADAIDLIARRAGGSARDALSALDQALAVGGGTLDGVQVQAAFGGVPFEQRVAVLEAVGSEDVAGALVGVHGMLLGGHDARRVADDLLRTLRDAFLCANSGGRVPYGGPAEDAARLAALAERIGNVALVRGIEVMGQAIVDIRGQAVADPRLVLEVAVVRLARREARSREETLLDRVERLERQVASGAAAGGAPAIVSPDPPPARAAAAPPDAGGPMLAARSTPSARKPANAKPANAKPARAEPDKAEAAVTPDDDAAPPGPSSAPLVVTQFDDVVEAWPAALASLKAPLRAAIQDAQPIGMEDGVIVFGAPPGKRFETINARFRSEAAAIKAALEPLLGSQPRFRLRAHDFETIDALKPVSGTEPATAAPEVPGPPAQEELIDLDELTEAPDAAAPDPAARLVAGLGAEVVEERPRT